MKVNRLPEASRKTKKPTTLRPHDEVLRTSLCLICYLSFKSLYLSLETERKSLTTAQMVLKTPPTEMHPTSLPQGE